MNQVQALRSTKFIHRWVGLALIVGLLAGSSIGLPDWGFWALYAVGAGAGMVLQLQHWNTRRHAKPRPARTAKAKALRVTRFLHRWLGLIWGSAMLLVFVGLPEGVLATFLPLILTSLILTFRQWWITLRGAARRRTPEPEAVAVG